MTRGLSYSFLPLFLILLSTACSPSEEVKQQQPPIMPTLHEEVRELPTATLPDSYEITLELAITREEITQGLMFRPKMAANRGMLFLFKRERTPSFWMKNTLIPLDIIFLDSRGKVVDISPDARPCTVDPCPQFIPKGPAAAVLELNSGSAAAHHLVAGAQITFQRLPAFPKPEETADD